MRRPSRGFWCTMPQAVRISARRSCSRQIEDVDAGQPLELEQHAARASAGRVPARQRSSVDLPEPDSPTMPSTSPGQSSKRHIAAADAIAVEPRQRCRSSAAAAARRDRRRATHGAISVMLRVLTAMPGVAGELAAALARRACGRDGRRRGAVSQWWRVGAHEHLAARVVDDDLVEIAVRRAAQRAGLVPLLHRRRDDRRSRGSSPRSTAGWHRSASRGRRRTAAAPGSCAIFGLSNFGIGLGLMTWRPLTSTG